MDAQPSKRKPTILTDDLAHEWIFGDLTEDRIKEIGTFQFPAELMQAKTIRKDFKAVENPLEECSYNELPELV